MIDPEVLSNMKMSQFVGHAPKPPHILRNQVPYDLERDEREGVPESPMMRGKNIATPTVKHLVMGSLCSPPETNPLSLVPKPYRQVEIKYTKLGQFCGALFLVGFLHCLNKTNLRVLKATFWKFG